MILVITTTKLIKHVLSLIQPSKAPYCYRLFIIKFLLRLSSSEQFTIIVKIGPATSIMSAPHTISPFDCRNDMSYLYLILFRSITLPSGLLASCIMTLVSIIGPLISQLVSFLFVVALQLGQNLRISAISVPQIAQNTIQSHSI